MSNRLLTAGWAAPGLTSTEKLVLARLADRANDAGECWPGQRSIAADCSLTERSVRDALKLMASKGHLTVIHNGPHAGRGESRITYRIHPKTPEAGSPATPEAGSPATPEAGSANTGNSHHQHRNVVPKAPENNTTPITITEPSVNHQGEPGTVPTFEPVKRGMYPREYDELLKRAKQEIQRVKNDPASHARDMTEAALELIAFVRKRAEAGWEARIVEIKADPRSFEHTAMKPNAAAIVRAWKARIAEIQRAKDGQL